MRDQLERVQLLGLNLALSIIMIIIGILSFIFSLFFMLTGWALSEEKWLDMFESFNEFYFLKK